MVDAAIFIRNASAAKAPRSRGLCTTPSSLIDLLKLLSRLPVGYRCPGLALRNSDDTLNLHFLTRKTPSVLILVASVSSETSNEAFSPRIFRFLSVQAESIMLYW
jgi:hypothetical protein